MPDQRDNGKTVSRESSDLRLCRDDEHKTPGHGPCEPKSPNTRLVESAMRTPLVIIDKHTPPSDRTDENVLAVLDIFERTGRDSIAGNRRVEFEAEARTRGLR